MTNQLKLIGLISPEDHLSDQAAKANRLQTTSKAVAVNEEEKLGEPNNFKRTDRNVDAALQQQKSVEQPVTGTTASNPIAEEMTALKEELEKLKVQIGGVDVCKSEATFIFELKGVEALLAAVPKKENRSELFYCRSEFEIQTLDSFFDNYQHHNYELVSSYNS